MNTTKNNSFLHASGFRVEIVKKKIKNTHLSVLPPYGHIRVTIPLHTKSEVVRLLIIGKRMWIKKQQSKFLGQDRQTIRKYTSGESHYYFGKRFTLDVIYKHQSPSVSLKGKTKIVLTLKPKCSQQKKAEIMNNWYRQELKIVVQKMVDRWQNKMRIQVGSWTIRRMKTRWGTCNHSKKIICLNLELAKKPHVYIEYVVVHEMIHLIEQKHNDRFVSLLNQYLPKWRSSKENLNRFILSHELWKENE